MSIDIKIKTPLYSGAIAPFRIFAQEAGGSLKTLQWEGGGGVGGRVLLPLQRMA